MAKYHIENLGNTEVQILVNCNQPCNKVSIDISKVKTLTYKIYAIGGPGTVKSGIRTVKITCPTANILKSDPIKTS